MNAKKILQVVLMFLCGGGCALAQIEASQHVQITIMGVPAEDKANIDAIYTVSETGMVNLPSIAKTRAAGRTPEQLAADIEKAYMNEGIYVTPKVAVINKTGIGDGVAVVYVGGQIRTPGPIDFAAGMTLWKAIQAAGGATEFGSLKRVNIYRDGKQTTYDLTVMANKEIPLEKNDTVEVPSKSHGCR